MKKYIIPIILALAVIASITSYHKGFVNGKRWYANQIDTSSVTQIDTNKTEKPIADTEYVDKPVPYPVYLKGDTKYITKTEYKDSIVYVMLPRTVKEYRKENYYAKISGIDPSLDYIETYNKTETNTVFVPKKDNRKDYLEFDATFIWNYQLSAPVTVSYGHNYGLFDVYAGGGYDFIQRSPILMVGTKMVFKF